MHGSPKRRVLLSLLLVGLGAGCPASRPMSVPPGEPAVLSGSPAGTGQTGSEHMPESKAELRADGAACFSSANCASNICEGASCDESRPGTCVPTDRFCTADVVEYCGCDDKTFVASSSCPGEAFSSRGPCQGDGPESEVERYVPAESGEEESGEQESGEF